MKRRTFLAAATGMLGTGTLSGVAVASPEANAKPGTSEDARNTPKPNVLFILADQHNAKVLGHKGHPNVKTPNLSA